jgi:hypothetical protein
MKSRDQTSVLLSVAAIHAAAVVYNEFKADGVALFLAVECKESVKLDIAFVKSKYGLMALVEDNPSCQVFSWSQMDNGQWSLLTDVADKQSVESDGSGWSNLPIYYGETKTCKSLGIYVPGPESSSLPIVECYA